jgi:hypothetical protein
LRKLTVFLVLMACFLLYLLYSLPLEIGPGIGASVAHFMGRLGTKVQALLDTSPPTPPQNLSGGAAPTIQRVARYYNGTHVTTHSMSPFDSTGGDLLVVFAGTHEDALLTPSDNFNNTWISLAGPTNFGPTSSSGGTNLRAQFWYAKNPKVGPNHVFTMTLSKSEALVLSLFVVKGSNVLDPIDAFSAISNDADTRSLIPTSPKIATTDSNDLLIGFAKSRFSELWRAGDGFSFQPDASSDYLVAESGLAARPDNYESSFVISSPTNWQAAIVAVRPAESLSKTGPITLAWQPSSDNVGVVGYQVERCGGVDCEDFAQIGTSKDPSFVDWTLPPGVYRYRVRAFDAASNVSKYSNPISVEFSARTTAGAR